jgi:hypothetical protein
MRLEWAHDSAFRFFPTQRHELLGYVLHPVDLATNKASAGALGGVWPSSQEISSAMLEREVEKPPDDTT